jgi:isopentenyldiphosphate isomerase
MGNSAQDPTELFDVLRADGTPTGEVKARALIHRDGDWHRGLHVWVAGGDESGPFLLAQRRSRDKDTWPGRLDVTVGGHFRAGEGFDQVLREIEEEIGMSPDPGALRSLGIRVAVGESEPGILDRELDDVYVWRSDAPLADYAPNPDELIELVKLPLEPLLDLLAGTVPVVTADSLHAADRVIQPTSIRVDDFIPTIDRYFYRAAIAASRVLSGETHIAI